MKKVTMKVELDYIYNAAMCVNELLQKDMPYKQAAAISRLAEEIQFHLTVAEKERLKILDAYTLRDENDNILKDEQGNNKIDRDGFQNAWTEFLDTEIEDEFTQVDFASIPEKKASELTIKPVLLNGISKFSIF